MINSVSCFPCAGHDDTVDLTFFRHHKGVGHVHITVQSAQQHNSTAAQQHNSTAAQQHRSTAA
jgi:acetylornithine deacetylase/succinyl-diaminopimelate desuccinylase-like protein